MAQRDSGFERIERDAYYTPGWVTRLILPHLDKTDNWCDPAYGRGHILKVISSTRWPFFTSGYDITPPSSEWVFTPDVFFGHDFIQSHPAWSEQCQYTFITNPPYGKRGKLAEAFIEKCLSLTHHQIAMLLPVDFDSAKTRRHLFQHPEFAMKGILLKRIQWEGIKHTASPSVNHAWYVWKAGHNGPPIIKYLHPDDMEKGITA